MNDTSLKEIVVRQFARSWQVFVEAVQSFTAEEWRTGDVDYLIPARLAYHILEAAEFYSSETSFDFPSGHRFNCEWDGAKSDDLPSQEDILSYLADVSLQAETWLRGADLLTSDDDFPWAGGSVLDRAFYLLRHSHHHIGEMWSEIKRRGHALPDWH